MAVIIGVRFRTAGKVYDFDPGTYDVKKGGHVIVETSRGVEYGEVITGPHEVEDTVMPLKEIIRPATEEDIRHVAENKQKQKEAFFLCKEKIRRHGLEMKLIDCEFTFDNSKILFYFTADGRVDFRELVKDLAGVFRTRIELRQVGVRDETKMLGGLGICGRPFCCHSYLSDFVPVSIRMAKEQNLSLNPVKISGVCGRLMCCLKNEEEVYEELNKKLPNVGESVVTPDGLHGDVQSVSILKQLVKVVVSLPNDEKEIREYQASELSFRPRKPKENRAQRGTEKDGEKKPQRPRAKEREKERVRGGQTAKRGATEEAEIEHQTPLSEKELREKEAARKESGAGAQESAGSNALSGKGNERTERPRGPRRERAGQETQRQQAAGGRAAQRAQGQGRNDVQRAGAAGQRSAGERQQPGEQAAGAVRRPQGGAQTGTEQMPSRTAAERAKKDKFGRRDFGRREPRAQGERANAPFAGNAVPRGGAQAAAQIVQETQRRAAASKDAKAAQEAPRVPNRAPERAKEQPEGGQS